MKKNVLQKGFTLIELLVVVAIIAILSTAVLASLNSARSKAKDARIGSEVSSIRAQMELYYNNSLLSYGDTNGASACFAAPFNDTAAEGPLKLIRAISTDITGSATVDAPANKLNCQANGQSWVVAALLNKGGIVCADASGVSKTIAGTDATTAVNSTDALCN